MQYNNIKMQINFTQLVRVLTLLHNILANTPPEQYLSVKSFLNPEYCNEFTQSQLHRTITQNKTLHSRKVVNLSVNRVQGNEKPLNCTIFKPHKH